eukprot:266101_1
MAMTAPVVMEKEPEKIAMTAPVMMENDGEGGMKKMMFMLPAEYDDMAKIPKPTNPAVHIEEIPSEVGAVHRYNGRFTDELNREKAKELGDQLMQDGVAGITEEYVDEHFQFWGYNPPFTLPYFRRNEVWVKLNDDQLNYLTEKYPAMAGEGRLVGGSPPALKGRNMFTVGVCGLAAVACAVVFFKKGTQ